MLLERGLLQRREHRKGRNTLRREQGFTFVELFVVLAIVAFLTFFIIPKLSQEQIKPVTQTNRIIVDQYIERPSGARQKIRQYLILTTGQEYYKTRAPKEDAPPSGIPGEYTSTGELNYDIILNSDGTASYYVYSTKLATSFVGGLALSISLEKDKTIEKLRGYESKRKMEI